MKKLKNSKLTLLLSLVLIACSSADRFIYIAPEYKNLNQSNVEILIMPLISTLLESDQLHNFIEKKNQNKQLLTSKEVELIDNYLPILLAENTFAKIIKAEKQLIQKQIKFNYVSAQSNPDSSNMMYMPEIKDLIYDGKNPDYLFFIEDAYFVRTGDEKGVSMGRGSQSFFILDAGIKYILLDNRTGKVAAMGRLKSTQKLLSLPGKESYLVALETFISDMLSNSPLAQKKVYF